RQAIDETIEEMTHRAAQAFESKVKRLDGTIQTLAQSAASLRSSLNTMEQTAQKIEALPSRLATAQQSLTNAANRLIEAANEARQDWWFQLLMLILACMIGAATVGIGRAVFERLVPPSAVQRNANWAQTLWSKATPQERALMTQIVNRPGR
ncbi:MAG: hypothetical protein ACP5GA_10955, partial [Acidithiobacillus sp.]